MSYSSKHSSKYEVKRMDSIRTQRETKHGLTPILIFAESRVQVGFHTAVSRAELRPGYDMSVTIMQTRLFGEDDIFF